VISLPPIPNPRASFALVLCVLAGLVAAPLAARAQPQPSVTIEVDKTRVGMDGELQVTVSVRGNADRLVPPPLDDFNVAESRTERRIDYGRSATFSQIYVLTPKKAGTFKIGPAQATVNGQVVAEAAAVTVTVEEAKAPEPVSPEDAMNLERLAKDAAFIRWEVPRTSFYVGEPFPLTLQLWVRNDLHASNPELVQNPKLDGLLVEDLRIDPARNGERRTVGRQSFDVYPLSTQLATPLKAGKLLLEATSLRLGLGQGGFLSSGRRVTLTTDPYHLDILEVPTAGRPAGFSARNVGQLKLAARLIDERGAEPTRIRTGQRLILRAEVSGTGNLVALEAPTLASGTKDFELSPLSGTADDRLEKTKSGMSGVRVFQWIVSALNPGNLTTPTLSLDVWNPMAARFEHLEVPGRNLEVTGASVSREADQATALGEDVGPIIEVATLSRSAPSPLARSPLYWAALALPLLGWVLIEWRHRRGQSDRKHPGLRASREAAHNAKKRLRAAERAMKDGLVKDFYGHLARTLSSYLEERANIPATGMTHVEVRQAARAAGYPADLIDAWVVEMENCDFARFAPSGSASDRMREAAGRVAQLVDKLDQVQPERRP
jgi:hypothetical protein